MLSIKIDGQPVDLQNDFSVTLNLKSPIFSDVGSYSYPFTIPCTTRNKIAFGFRHRVANTNSIYHEFEGEYLWNGKSLFFGTIKLKAANTEVFEGYLMEGKGDFNYKRKHDTLQNIDFGSMGFTNENDAIVYVRGCKGKIYPERNVCFPQIYNETYFEEAPTDPDLLWFNKHDGAGNISLVNGHGNRYVIVPMLFLRYVLQKIFEKFQYQLEDDFFSANPDFNSCVLYNSVDCNGPLEGETGTYFRYTINKLYFNYHVPRMSINDFFSSIEKFFNIRLFVNNTLRTVRIVSVDNIMKSNDFVDFSNNIVSISTELTDKIEGFHFKMDLDGDDPVFDGLNTGDEDRIKRFKNPVQLFSDLPTWPSCDRDEIRFVVERDEFYSFCLGGEVYYAWRPLDFTEFITYTQFVYKNIVGNSIATKFSTLNDLGKNAADVGNKRANWKDIAPRIFFINSIIEGGNVVSEMALSHTPGMSLFYNGDKGLFAKNYNAYCNFMLKTKLVKIVKLMSYTELSTFDFSKKYMINGIMYLVSSIQVTIKRDRIMPAKLECYPCN